MSASANAVEGRIARDHALQIEKAMQSSVGAADAGLKEEEEAEEESEELEDEDLESSEDVEGFSKATEVGDDVKEGRTPDGALLLAWPPSVCCRVGGCREDMWLAGDYHRKHRVCKLHAAAEKVFVNQQEQRFCQQCSRFHTLAEFDEGKRSCRKRLAYHNERRRRHQSDSVMKFIEDACHPKGGNTRKSDFTGEQKGKRVKSACEVSSPPACTSVRQNNENTVKAEQVLPTETFSLPKTLKSKYSKNDDEGQNIRSKRHKESDKNWFLPGRLDQHSSDDGIPEATPNVSPIFSQSEVESKVYGAGGNTYVPQYGSSVRVGIELGDGIVLPPLAIKREGKLILLREWPAERGGSGTLAEADREDEHGFQLRKDGCNKKDWQKGDEETLFHCLWDCPKVQPVWKWAGRALSKIRGRKVSLEWKQAVLGERLGCWALPETISVWKLLRGIILGQVWHARKGKVYSAKQWTPGQIIRSTWVDLMMYAMQEWLEVLKTKGSLKQEEAQLLCTRFDKKWLVNGFVGRRTDWSMAWKDSYEVLLE